MNRLFAVLIVVGLSAAVLTARVMKLGHASQQSDKAPFMVSFADLKWADLPERKGMQFAILSGDPKSGEYTQMRKVPAGTNNPLHSHSSEIKNVIISGVWYTGVDAASARDFGPGSCKRLPRWQRVRVLPGRQR